ncbi:flagellar hook-basal body protein [Agarivorans sp. DSG3-1]|uniref:flagellar hook-basal body protein n=1 Tax=Agarivorans sp. DSG3-1 TaxID=3342249 RepID=UPI00398E98FC
MIDALYIAGSGIQTQQTYVDVISNNIANVNTIGYKRDSVSFSQVVSGDSSAQNAKANEGSYRGNGASVNEINSVFENGDLRATDSELDIAISGQGFLELVLDNGSHAYTRVGQLTVNADRNLSSQSGHVLSSNISVPLEAKSLKISSNGEVYAQLPEQTDLAFLGELELSRFTSVTKLESLGSGLYAANESSGSAYYGKPGEEGFGEVKQGFLEVSNVSMVAEMVNLVLAQRAYQLNARVVQAADQLMETANNLARG